MRLLSLLLFLCSWGCSAWNHPRTLTVTTPYRAVVKLDAPRASSCAAACAPRRVEGPEPHAACLSRCPGARVAAGECGARDVPPLAECATIHRTATRKLPNRERTLELLGAAALGITTGAVVGYHVGRIAPR